MNNMKNKILRGANSLLAVLFLFTFVATPYFTFAATKGGAKPGDTFYVLDIFFEKADLAFTFNKEKRVQKIIANSEERLAEADDAAVEGKPDVMEKAMSGYQEGISLAIDEAKKINDKEKTKELLSGIGDSVSKHKDVLTAVYDSAPEASKESAEKAIAINTLEQEKVAEEIIAVQFDVAPTQTEEVIEKSQKEQEEKPVAQKQDDVNIGNKTTIIVSESASKQTQPNLEANKENITPKLASSASSKTAGGGWSIGVVTSGVRPVIPATPAIPATPTTNNTPAIPAIPATPASPNQSSSSVSLSSSSVSSVSSSSSASFSSSVSSSVGTSSSSSSVATSTSSQSSFSSISSSISSSNSSSSIGSSSSVSQDIAPPTISKVQTIDITEISANITWTTNESASGEVYYAPSSLITATSTVKIIGENNITSHNISLTGLSSSKTYFYVAVSKDVAGNIATSSEQSFTTLTPPSPVSSWSNNSLGISGEYQSTAWNGNGYGVVYGWNGKLYFLKLDSSGNKLGEPGIVATAPNYVFWTNIVWDGSKYGVAWSEANPHNIRFAILDIDGNVLSNIVVTAGTDNANTERPAILWTGSEYILIWSGGWPDNFNNPYVPTNIIYFSKIASDGQTVIINKKKSITSGDARAANGPIVSAYLNGSSIGVLWQDIRDSGDSNNPTLYFNILDNNGDKLISNDVKVSGVGRVGSPQIFAEGANYIVFWRESTATDVNANSMYVAKLDSAGNKTLANQNLNTKGDNEIRPSVTKTDNGYGITWTSYPEQKIYFKSINSSASIIIDNEFISTIYSSNDNAYIVWGNNKYGVVWRNVQNNQSQLYFGSK